MLDDSARGLEVEVIALPEDLERGGASAASSPTHTPCTPAHLRSKLRPPPGGVLTGIYTIVRRFEFSAEKQRNVVGERLLGVGGRGRRALGGKQGGLHAVPPSHHVPPPPSAPPLVQSSASRTAACT